MDWKLEIKRVNNGYVLKGKFGDNEIVSTYLVEEKDEENSELEAMKQLLWEVKEYFAVCYSKHNKKNLIIEIK